MTNMHINQYQQFTFFFLSILEESRHYPQNAKLGQAWQSIAIDMTRTSKTLP